MADAALNLRGIDRELRDNLKARAKAQGKTLRDYCIEVLHAHVALFDLTGTPVPAAERSAAHGCESCGALVGHQKGCERA